MYDLSGKVALVTGAGGRHGIGRAIATRLAREGADVVVTDIPESVTAIRAEDRAEGWEGLPSVVREIEAEGRQALGIFSDVSDSAQVDDMVQQVLDRFGKIDILVNNAGSRPGRDRVLVVDLEEDAFDEVMRVNVRGTYLCSRAVARHMVARNQAGNGGGKIIIISSGAGKARHRPLRRLLCFQVRTGRLHPGLGPRNGGPQGQRQRHLPRPGGHGAGRLHRSRPGCRGRIGRGTPGTDGAGTLHPGAHGPHCPGRRHRQHGRLPVLRRVGLHDRLVHQRLRRLGDELSNPEFWKKGDHKGRPYE